jgi:predicted alpha/beta-hydrolase family hydrolase
MKSVSEHAMQPQQLKVKINENESVTALLYAADKKVRGGITLILGHGAGAGQLSPFMVLFATELAKRGLDVITFNFSYMEQGRSAPDQKAKLESCYQAVIDTALANKKLKGNRVAIGGKSMGGRIASQVAATTETQINGLVFLGYPLHPPGKPEQLRDKHLKDVKAPMLFIQGSRDAFGSPDELSPIIKKLKRTDTLFEIKGGDHSLKVPKSVGLTQQQVYEGIWEKITSWLADVSRA